MDIIADLIARAADLQRRIYASLPFEHRLADLFTKLAVDSIEALGKSLGAEFLARGVTGMPDPGTSWNPHARHPELTLPAGYLREFASATYRLLLAKFQDPSVVDDAVQRYLLKLTTTRRIKPVPLKSAESYVRYGLVQEALDLLRQRRQRALSLDLSVEDDGLALADLIDDPKALLEMQRELSPRVWKLWMTYLAQRLHEDVPEYLGLSMQGFTDLEIIGDPRRKGLPGMLTHYKPPPSGANSFLKSFVYKNPRRLEGLLPRPPRRAAPRRVARHRGNRSVVRTRVPPLPLRAMFTSRTLGGRHGGKLGHGAGGASEGRRAPSSLLASCAKVVGWVFRHHMAFSRYLSVIGSTSSTSTERLIGDPSSL